MGAGPKQGTIGRKTQAFHREVVVVADHTQQLVGIQADHPRNKRKTEEDGWKKKKKKKRQRKWKKSEE